MASKKKYCEWSIISIRSGETTWETECKSEWGTKSKCHFIAGFYNEPLSMDNYVFCPNCGKPIKVVKDE